MELEHLEGPRVDLSHGAGGKAFDDLFRVIIKKHLNNEFLAQKADGTVLPSQKGRLVLATDSHVVSPLFFPGGNIGKIAFCGTVNDLAMMGARPLYLTLGLIIEEGFPISKLEIILETIGKLASEKQIPVVAGDTKVVEKDKADGIFISMTGLGVIDEDQHLLDYRNIKKGDKIIVSGSIGDHAVSILALRHKLDFDEILYSDCQSLEKLTLELISKFKGKIKCFRDPTRGGVSAVLNEWASDTEYDLEIDERQIIQKDQVRATCELLGLDVCHLANEGKLVVVVSEDCASEVEKFMQERNESSEARIIGEVKDKGNGKVFIKTKLGSKRILPWPIGEQLPRIC